MHIINDGGEGSPYDIRAHIGAISDEVAPRDGEPVVVKQFPNSFHQTDLEKTLTELGAAPGSGKDLVIAGFMTHMCVNYTAQGAFNLGYRPTVVAEATATRALAAPDGTVAARRRAPDAPRSPTITDLFGIVVPKVDALPESDDPGAGRQGPAGALLPSLSDDRQIHPSSDAMNPSKSSRWMVCPAPLTVRTSKPRARGGPPRPRRTGNSRRRTGRVRGRRPSRGPVRAEHRGQAVRGVLVPDPQCLHLDLDVLLLPSAD